MSLFGRLFRREKPRPAAHQALAMVMLADTDRFSGSAALAHLASHWTDLPSIADAETAGEATTASIPGGAIALMHLPMPIPAVDLEGPVAVAWHWPGAEAAVAAHRSHVIVHTASTTLPAIDLRLLLTKLVASVLAVGDGVGVYVGDAMLVRSAEDYREDAESASREALPLLSWVGFNPVREDATLSVYTTGLTSFGLLELEVRRSARPAAELFGTLADVANYQLTSGQVLRDGDTFGASPFDRTKVRYGASAFIPDVTVAALELP